MFDLLMLGQQAVLPSFTSCMNLNLNLKIFKNTKQNNVSKIAHYTRWLNAGLVASLTLLATLEEEEDVTDWDGKDRFVQERAVGVWEEVGME